MTEVLEVAKSIGELGIFVVIAAAFIYMVYQNWKIKNDKDKEDSAKYNQVMDDIRTQNNDLVDKLVSIKKQYNITPEQYNNTSKLGNEINDALERIRNKTDASRACLVQFHNRTDTI